jgi:hypothetical protein
VQTPLAHVSPAATTCVRSVQSLLQAPHVWRSLVETQPAAHASWPGAHALDESSGESAADMTSPDPLESWGDAESAPPSSVLASA